MFTCVDQVEGDQSVAEGAVEVNSVVHFHVRSERCLICSVIVHRACQGDMSWDKPMFSRGYSGYVS